MSERSEEFMRLLVEGALSEDQAQDLLVEFQNDPQALHEASRLHQVHRLLAAHMPSEELCERVISSVCQKANQQVENRVMQKIRSVAVNVDAGSATPRRSWSMSATLALAASLTLVLGIWFWWGISSKGEIVAKVLEASSKSGFKVGDAVMAGAIIQTGKDEQIKLAYRDGVAEVVLGKNSKLLTIKSKAEKTLHLEIGQLTATVAKQPKDKPFVVTTPQAEIRVVGTRFDVLTNEKLTKVKVSEGEVLMEGSDNKVIAVKAGFMAAAGNGVWTDPVPMDGKQDQNLSGGMMFFRDFETIFPGEKSPNELVRLYDLEGEVTAMKSNPSKGHSPNFRPDVELSLLRLSPNKSEMETLYVVPDNMEIRIRIKSEFPGKWSIGQSPTNPRFKMEHFYAVGLDVDDEWREVVLHRSDFRPYRAEKTSRNFVPGVEICAFSIYGFGTGEIYLDSFAVVSPTPDNSSP